MTNILRLEDDEPPSLDLEPQELVDVVAHDIAEGARFAGLFGSADHDRRADPAAAGRPDVVLTAALVRPGGISLHRAPISDSYPSLTTVAPAAFWYERAVHDLFGIVPVGHPRLDPLLLPLPAGVDTREHPPALAGARSLVPDERSVPRHVHGRGLFTIPHGPVRSGVSESVEFLVETPGEDIPHLQVRIFAKHRAVQQAFAGRSTGEATLVAERVEGIASLAHALAFCHAVEDAVGLECPPAAALVRVLHAELERIANHLDVAIKLCEAAGLAVALARFSFHKEEIMRIRDHLCGNRFSRGVVVPGGVSALPPDDADLTARLSRVESDIRADARVLMVTSSFLDRLRGTGPLEYDVARKQGALGPIARASGYHDDGRIQRPYDAYPLLDLKAESHERDGDAMARLKVRWHEVEESFALVRQVRERLHALGPQAPLRSALPPATGTGVGAVEAPQGEVLYVVDLEAGRVRHCWPRSASFHNLALFHQVFASDILTDFPFIEASFGLSIAGAAS
jgi:formate hydrogenlyase subunit 5